MSASERARPRPRVLVVDDDDGMRENLAELLSSAGYEVLTASDTDQALRVIASRQVDLLLTELRMPGPDGLDLIASARECRPGLRAILMAAFESRPTEAEVIRRGRIGYIQKPFEADEVTGLVERILALTEA